MSIYRFYIKQELNGYIDREIGDQDPDEYADELAEEGLEEAIEIDRRIAAQFDDLCMQVADDPTVDDSSVKHSSKRATSPSI